MNLGEALSRLKKEKSRLARLTSLRKQNVFVEEGKSTKFNPNELSQDIESKIDGIRKLKLKIQETNIKTKVAGTDLTLAEAIIKVGDMRSSLSHLSTLFEKKESLFYRSKDEKELAAQMDELEVEDAIEKLEIEKAQLDNKIQMANWTTTLTD